MRVDRGPIGKVDKLPGGITGTDTARGGYFVPTAMVTARDHFSEADNFIPGDHYEKQSIDSDYSPMDSSH